MNNIRILFRRLFILSLFIITSSLALAQNPTVLTSAAPGWGLFASEPKGDFDTLKLPIIRAGNLLLIEGEVDGMRGNFIFDTGAPGLVLNTSYFRQNAIKKNRTSVGIAGSTNAVYELEVNKLQISTLYYEKMIVELTDLSHIENNKNIRILGLLGIALFDDLEITLDTRKNTLMLVRPNKKNSSRLIPDVLLPLSTSNNTLFIPMKIANKNLNVCFDTGAEQMVLDNELSQKILNTVQLNKRLNLTGTGGQKIEVWSGTLQEAQIGKHSIQNVSVLLSSLYQLSEAFGQPIDAIIGYSLMEQGVIHINIPKKEFGLYLYKENANE